MYPQRVDIILEMVKSLRASSRNRRKFLHIRLGGVGVGNTPESSHSYSLTEIRAADRERVNTEAILYQLSTPTALFVRFKTVW